MNNFFVDKPVAGGIDWYLVKARSIEIDGVTQENWTMASFSKHMPNADKEAKELCDRLNGEKPALNQAIYFSR